MNAESKCRAHCPFQSTHLNLQRPNAGPIRILWIWKCCHLYLWNAGGLGHWTSLRSHTAPLSGDWNNETKLNIHSPSDGAHSFMDPTGSAKEAVCGWQGWTGSLTALHCCRAFWKATETAGTLSQKQRIFPRNTLECIWEQVPWPVNFQSRFNPSPFGNFPKHLTLFPSEISEKSREEKQCHTAKIRSAALLNSKATL
jgi:hypothetical protein